MRLFLAKKSRTTLKDEILPSMHWPISQSLEELLDLYDGIKDIEAGVVRAVGEPQQRFEEDALRILRAVRIAAELNFTIEEKTKEAIAKNAAQLAKISKERIRDEFVRIVNSPHPMKALLLAHSLGLLGYIVPELEQGIGIEQNQAHSYDVFEHNLRALQHAADKRWPLDVRLAALLHDIGKPKARRCSDDKARLDLSRSRSGRSKNGQKNP